MVTRANGKEECGREGKHEVEGRKVRDIVTHWWSHVIWSMGVEGGWVEGACVWRWHIGSYSFIITPGVIL